jgi:mannonate dehydratase
MDRRAFLQSATAVVIPVPPAAAASSQGGTSKPAHAPLMKLGTQYSALPSEDTLRAIAAFGVEHICCGFPAPHTDAQWSVEGLKRLRDHIGSFGIHLVMVPLPLSSSYITRARNPAIMLGESPERDREIEKICGMIRDAAAAGIPALKYNLTLLGVVRTRPTRGRGGAIYSTFNYQEAVKESPPLTPPVPSAPNRCGSESLIFWSASCPWPRRPRSASPVILTIPPCLAGVDSAACIACSAEWTA